MDVMRAAEKLKTANLDSCQHPHTMSTFTTDQLAAILQKASDAYYNKDTPIMSDADFDRLRDQLEARNPEHPFLKQIRAPTKKGQTVRLPHIMPSLDKIKPGTGAVDSFSRSSTVKSWVLSEKLDGISILWCSTNGSSPKLYFGGDGFDGVDLTFLESKISGIPRGAAAATQTISIRGELVIPESELPEGALGRSIVNGLLHQSSPPEDQIRKVRFIAYELLEPSNLTRAQQMSWLQSNGWMTPWWSVVSEITDETLGSVLLKRRAECIYAMDGIVVGQNSVPIKPIATSVKDVKNPKDMRAFKMVLEDQQATTEIVEIHWNASHQGYWIPRIQIQPVQIGGSRIEFLTGHNARLVLDKKLGKGAKIIIRKSGDVIPTLDTVLVPANAENILLPKGVWDGPADSAKHLKLAESEFAEHEGVIQRKLENFAKVMDIASLGPGLIAKFIAAGKKSVGALLTSTQEECQAILGKSNGVKIYNGLQKCLDGSKAELDWMLASSVLPRGVGNTKLQSLFAVDANPDNWCFIENCEGWSNDALNDFVENLPQYIVWRRKEVPQIPYPVSVKASITQEKIVPVKKEYVCFTGFRSAEMENALLGKGHEVQKAMTKQTTILVIADDAKESEKIKKARENNIRIVKKSDFIL